MTRRWFAILALVLAPTTARAEWALWSTPWHDAAIAAVDVAGDTTVSASWDGTLRWWSLPGLELRGQREWSPCSGAAVALSPDGTVALLHGEGRELAVVGREGAKRELNPGGSVGALAWASGGLVAGLADGSLRRWEAGSAEPRSVTGGEGVRALAGGPGGLLVGRGDEFGAVELRDARTLELIRAFSLARAQEGAHPSAYFLPPNGLAWSLDGRRAAAAADEALVWDVGTGLLVGTIAVREPGANFDGVGVAAVALLGATGDELLVATMDGLDRWDVAKRARTQRGPVSRDWNGAQPATIALRAERGWALTGDIHGGLELRGLDGGVIAAARGQHASVRAVAFSPRGDVVVAGHGDGALTVWASPRRRGVIPVHRGAVSAVVFSPGGRLATAGDTRVVLWSLESATPPVVLEGHDAGATDAAWSPDGTRVVTAAQDGRVRLWDANTGALLRTWSGHPGGATSVAWGPRVASVGEDGVLRTWDPGEDEGHASAQEPRAYTGVAWSSDGSVLATTEAFRGPSPVRLWSADLVEIRQFEAGDLGCHDVTFSPLGELVAACLDARARIWALPGGTMSELRAFDGYGMSVALNARGTRLALGTSGQEQALRVWTRR